MNKYIKKTNYIYFIYGNKRNQLHNLYKPILIGTKYYDNENEYISKIFQYAIKGLAKLNDTYHPRTPNHYACM